MENNSNHRYPRR